MSYQHGPREDTPKTVRLEDQSLPDRESSYYTPRAGDWLLLAVLMVALLAIGGRVWALAGWGDTVGRAVFFGLALMAVYWAALIYTFKLSLAARVGPQGLAIVRGPWRVGLSWSEITRLMERPQVVGGRRYRWVVALARDGRRIQVREDALLDYERFRREVYERYRLWRDHGGTWGATGGGPFTARETVSEEARWWAVGGLLIALSGLYLALLLPPGGLLAGLALLALALGCMARVVMVFLGRRTYALDGRMIEARGAIERIHLAWRDVTKVERSRHPAGGAILALVAAGRLALGLAARGDAGIRGFPWSPRVPEYVTLRGGGRHARIRLHHLAQPEELLAWVEFYTGLRRGGPSRPLEPAAASSATQAEPRRTAGMSQPSGPLQPAGAGRATRPDLTGRASRPDLGDFTGRASRADLGAPSGPLDPWAGEREGDLDGLDGLDGRTGPEPLGEPASSPFHDPMPEPLFRGAPLSASFREPGGLDTPPEDAESEAGRSDDAWLRETSAHFNMSGAAPSPSDAEPSYEPPAPPSTPAAGRPRQFAPAPGPRRSTLGAFVTPQQPPAAPPLPFPPSRSGGTAGPRPEPSFAPYDPDLPDGDDQATEEVPTAPAGRAPRHEQREPRYEPPVTPAIPATPAAGPFAAFGDPGLQAGWDEDERSHRPEREDRGEDPWDEGTESAEDAETEEAGPSAPWRDSAWQPPALPRFGPPSGPRPEAPRRDGHRTDR